MQPLDLRLFRRHQLSHRAEWDIPGWFWTAIEQAGGELQQLVDWLEKISRELLIEFAANAQLAAEAVCDPWAGPTIDGTTLSEDDVQDFATWVVSRGRAFWEEVCASADLEPFVRRSWAHEGTWSDEVSEPAYRGYQSVTQIAFAVFERRFGGDLFEALDEFFAERG